MNLQLCFNHGMILEFIKVESYNVALINIYIAKEIKNSFLKYFNLLKKLKIIQLFKVNRFQEIIHNLKIKGKNQFISDHTETVN